MVSIAPLPTAKYTHASSPHTTGTQQHVTSMTTTSQTVFPNAYEHTHTSAQDVAPDLIARPVGRHLPPPSRRPRSPTRPALALFSRMSAVYCPQPERTGRGRSPRCKLPAPHHGRPPGFGGSAEQPRIYSDRERRRIRGTHARTHMHITQPCRPLSPPSPTARPRPGKINNSYSVHRILFRHPPRDGPSSPYYTACGTTSPSFCSPHFNLASQTPDCGITSLPDSVGH